MAFLHMNYYSHELKYQTDLNIILPTPDGDHDVEDTAMPPYFPKGKKYQVLYLLHGTCGDCYDWIVRANTERLAKKYHVAVVMPSCQNSFFFNMASGPAYLDFLTKELPALVTGMLPISEKREDTFIAGLSMGGYGAWKAALEAPERYGAAASLSGVLDFPRGKLMEPFVCAMSDRIWPFHAIFGEQSLEELEKDPDVSLIAKLEQMAAEKQQLPALFLSVGTEDHTYSSNQVLRAQLERLGISYGYTEGSGSHDWDYWNEHLMDVLEWLPLRRDYAEEPK